MASNQNALDTLYTKKQQEVLQFYCNNDFFMLINHGAIRAGKTIINNELFLQELLRIKRQAKVKQPQYILAGASLGAIRRNVIHPLQEKYGLEIEFDNANRFKLLGVLVCCFGHDDIGALSSITGMTAYGAYINEGVLANKEVFEQILKRCSADESFNARIIIDTNPKDPKHHLKVNYIDKTGDKIKAFHWKLDDNTKLSEQYRENIRSVTPSGVFTNRDILGLWVTPEGAVYLDFSETRHIVDTVPIMRWHFVGVDWGYEHKGSMCIFGQGKDGLTYLIREITTKHKLIDWWVGEAKKIQKEFGFNLPFYCDDARPDLVAKFKEMGIWAVNANKQILSGVEYVAKLFKSDKLKLYKPGLKDCVDELYNYVWGKDGKPIKINDDVMDAMRYALYTDYKKRGGR